MRYNKRDHYCVLYYKIRIWGFTWHKLGYILLAVKLFSLKVFPLAEILHPIRHDYFLRSDFWQFGGADQ